MGQIKLNVSTAAITVPICDIDKDGNEVEIGSFRFNPSDIGIGTRFEEVAEKISNIGLPGNASYEEIVKLSEEVKEIVNYLLGYNCADEIFKVCNPLSPTANGDFFLEEVLEGVGRIIETETKQRLKKKITKIRRATAKYQK